MSADIPEIHFAPSNGARIAYQVFGEGDQTVVSIPPMAQNIETAWEQPLVRSMLDRFASFARFVIFDKRGTGASDRSSRIPGIDERVEDLRALMDHVGIDQAHLMGTSEGGPMAILFAATYPDRVHSLVLHHSGARTIPDEMLGMVHDQPERRYRMAEIWGTANSEIVERFAPSLATNTEFIAWHRRYERMSATSDSLRDLIDLMFTMDVRGVLDRVTVPTLVLHRTDDPIVPVELAREAAAGIPNAQLIEYDGVDHFPYAGKTEQWLTDLERFVTGTVKERPQHAPRGTPQIVTLGRFAVIADGAEVPVADWGSRLARQLCKRLVAARGWPVPREQLIEQLWPDQTDMSKLGARLSVQLSAVRRVLDGGVIADRETVRLDLAHVDVDLERFMNGDNLKRIVSEYQTFLPEDQYEDWSSGIRDEARTRFVDAVRTLASGATEAGRHRDAVAYARQLLEVDPYDGSAHRLLIESFSASSQWGEARGAHATWAAAMAELDVTVEPFLGPPEGAS